MYRIFYPPGQQKVVAAERWLLVIVYAKTTFFEPLYHVRFTELFDFFVRLLLLLFFCLFICIYLFIYLSTAVDVLQTLFLLSETRSNHGYSFRKTLSKKGKGGFG